MWMTQLALIKEVRSWYDQQGTGHGYFPEPKKSSLIVTPHFEDEGRLIGDLCVQIENGHRILGGVYLQQVMHACRDAFDPLQDAIFKAFYLALFERVLSDAGCELFFFPYQPVLLA